MHVTLSASGTPQQVNAAIASQAKSAAVGTSAWPTVAAARDYIAGHLAGKHPESQVTVAAELSIELEVREPNPPARGAASATADEANDEE